MSKPTKNKSKDCFYLKRWILNNRPSVQAVLAVLIRENIFPLNCDNFFLRIKPPRQHGLLGHLLKTNNLIFFFAWTNLDITLDRLWKY